MGRGSSHSNGERRSGRKPLRVTSLSSDLRDPGGEMDKYQVLEEWGAGAFGVTSLVAEPMEGRHFVVKKVECIDEREANLALEEVLPLLELQHPNICPYKEFFMVWDNQISSLFFCVVMEYCDGGNLEETVQLKRQQKQKIEENVIQRFLGQMADALTYIHSKNLPHRNLKPSNILVSGEDRYTMSDFLPQTLATDEMRFNVRLDPEQKCFMAPESACIKLSEASDVWSLGCIVLDLMTTSVCSPSDITDLLQSARVNSSCLDSAMGTLQGSVGYSEDLCCLVQKMLKIQPEERPSAKDLVNEPYVRKCLTLIGSPLSGVKKTLPPAVLDQLQTDSLESVLEFLQNHREYEDGTLAALRRLAGSNTDGIQGQIIESVSQAMTLHRDSCNVQLEGSRVLHHLLSQGLEGEDIAEYVSSDALISRLVGTAREYSHNASLLAELLPVMSMLAVCEGAAERLVKAEFLPDLVKILEDSMESREVCMSCCALLWSLAMTESASGDVLKRALPPITALIQDRRTDGEVLESASSALWILSLKGHVTEDRVEAVTLLLLESLQTHVERPVLVKNVCLALTGLVINSELAAYRMLVPRSDKSGVTLMKEVYALYDDDPEIVENLCQLFNEMANYGSTHAELRLQHVDELMEEIKDRYESVTEIVVLVDSTLSRLEK
ncbi:serine/threonine kinase-like domain-containing protein STKLD1 [Hyperolius riggenbachi]|uniref:serine/threonine kinase-like domain-containing protein STKLD1 n=1 Tax=Hyperolius riggenbachi TaxID=752182 RepID=UPI0035A322BE